MNNRLKPILLVEDTHNVRDFLEVTLKFKGYQVISTQNGEEALAKIAEERPSLVITDILMPKLDGFALVQKLRTDPETCDIPIVIISATYVTPDDRDFAYQLGIARFIEKPIDVENFLLTIAEVLTGDHSALATPLSNKDFLKGYYTRLETKLRYKNTQIVRIERLLSVLPENQKPSFVPMLEESIRDREVIQKELNQINPS